jgi:hypothetical protein
MLSKRRIISVTVRREVDDSPDLSFIGEYSRKPEGPNAIDRQERNDMGRNEYRYFNPTMTAEETGNPDSPEQDYRRMENYNRGEWCMMGVFATAEVVLTGNVVQKFRSGGLWGIESDSEESYFGEVAKEELSTLRDELKAVGFTTRQINTAFKNAKGIHA